MRKLLTISFLTLLFSCKTQKEKDILFIKNDLVNYMKDIAFKGNSKLEIEKFEIIKIDTFNIGYIDTMYIKKSFAKSIEKYNRRWVKIDYDIKNAKEILRLANLSDNQYYVVEYEEKIKNLDYELKKIKDTLNAVIENYKNKLVSASKYKSDAIGYEIKTLSKATFITKSKRSNILDTFYFYYTKNLLRIKEEDFQLEPK